MGGTALEDSGFLIESNFYQRAEMLWSQFDMRLSPPAHLPANNSPLVYAYSQNAYRHLVGMGENLFGHEILFDFLDRLRAWAQPTLGASYASTPRVQVYIDNCWRRILRDDIKVRWHYVFSLTPSAKHNRKIKIMTDSGPGDGVGFALTVGKVAHITLNFNELLVHDASGPYGVDDARASMNPLEGSVFLDGYLW